MVQGNPPTICPGECRETISIREEDESMMENAVGEQKNQEILAHYRDYGYVAIPNALSNEEVNYLNNLIDSDVRLNPEDWHSHRQGAAGNGQILMKYPELDCFVRHGKIFPLIQEILKGEARFAQLDFRDVPPELADNSGMNFHRDISYYGTTGGKIWDPDNPYKSTFLCAIYYLKDVHECCPSFCMAPNTHEYNTLDEAKEKLGSDYSEVPIRGKAGTAILYNITAYHTRKAGEKNCPHGRRTMHNYHSRESNAPLTDWATVPEELAMNDDRETQLFYSQWTPKQIVYASDNYKEIPTYYPVTILK